MFSTSRSLHKLLLLLRVLVPLRPLKDAALALPCSHTILSLFSFLALIKLNDIGNLHARLYELLEQELCSVQLVFQGHRTIHSQTRLNPLNKWISIEIKISWWKTKTQFNNTFYTEVYEETSGVFFRSYCELILFTLILSTNFSHINYPFSCKLSPQPKFIYVLQFTLYLCKIILGFPSSLPTSIY